FTNDECIICLESFRENSFVTQLNCRHTFHCRCIIKWCERKSSCPTCRSAI
ncbi:hypothetical protein HELRODRAFT_148159, partial [Helobdella robusta]|uniref:RING-type E3 ubiquitin transferase n=1 Tax=Helobdella robusta TaxID=6412 RepID=T1EK58_HELRO